MIKTLEIIPSVLETSEEGYETTIERLMENSDVIEGWVQIDVADGRFVPNTTIGLEAVAKYPFPFKKEVHLMVTDPLNYIEEVEKIGAKRVIFHLEAEQVEEAIEKAKSRGLQVGLALNPETPVAKVEPFIDRIDVVLLLSVHPGFQGGKLLPGVIEKIKEAHRLAIEKEGLVVEVDGGINDSNIKEVIDAGADIAVIGSFLIHGDISENLEKIWEAVYS